jgi:uncharacterized membrane protein YGL010W
MLLAKLSRYQQSHQKFFTKITHLIGVPLIVFAFTVVFNWVGITIHGVGAAPLTWIMIIVLTAYYCLLDWQLGLLTGLGLLILAVISFFWLGVIPTHKSFYVFLVCFLVGGFSQVIGHLIEGKLPALTDNVTQIFTAPLFIAVEIAFWCGLKQDLKQKLQTYVQ